jgi:exopolysaccharide biosynthesis polyprenyl glycosylphosphotransferase
MIGPVGGPRPGSLPAVEQADWQAAPDGPHGEARPHASAALLLPVADLLALGSAAAAAGRISELAVAYLALALIALAAGGLYRLRICLRVSDQVGRIVTAAVLPLAVLLPWLSAGYAWRLGLWSAGCLIAGRAVTYSCLRAAHRHGLLTEPTLVVGAGEMAVMIAKALRERPELGLIPLGFLDAFPAPGQELPLPLLGAAVDLPAKIREYRARRVIVCFPVDRDRELVPVLRACRSLAADICLVPRLQELGAVIPRACLDEIWGIPLVPLRRDSRIGPLVKRCFDVVAAAILLCLVWPILLVLAALIRLQSGRPAFFRQLRVTRAGRTSSIMKLRTLAEHQDSDVRWEVPDEHCTRLSRWLRESHLDELPQLVNVLRGDMSLVGPRPERPYFADQFSTEIPRYRDRSRVRAGMTGWAQANGLRGDTSMRDRIRFDNQYIEYWSPWLDIVILLRTITAALPHRRSGRR